MPFKQAFERRMNRNMQEGEPTPAAPDENMYEKDTKNPSGRKDQQYEEEDIEISEKKDRPPRFSTLFEGAPAPQVVERYIEPKRRSGVYIPTPLFIVLAAVLFFESTLLFAYTIIGLYNNLPHGILPFGGPSTAVAGACDCTGQQSGINFAPNFYLGEQNAGAVTVTSVATPLPDVVLTHTSTSETSTSTATSTSSSSSTSSSTSSSSSSSTSSLDKTVAAGGLMSILLGDKKTTSDALPVVTIHPTGKVVQSTVMKTVTPTPKPNVSTSYTTVEASKREGPASDPASGANTTPAATPTTLETSPSPPPPTTEGPSPTTDGATTASPTTTTSDGFGGACFGAGGAVFQNCVNGR